MEFRLDNKDIEKMFKNFPYKTIQHTSIMR